MPRQLDVKVHLLDQLNQVNLLRRNYVSDVAVDVDVFVVNLLEFELDVAKLLVLCVLLGYLEVNARSSLL